VEGRNFVTLADGVKLDDELQRRVRALCQYLIDNHLVTGSIVLTQGVRSRKTAHKWSTSWNIRKRRVPLKNLQDLPDGKDKDGNQWYNEVWEEGLARDQHGHFTKDSLHRLWDK